MPAIRTDAIAESLVSLCHALGAEDREWAILGEGNASVVVDDDTFYVKTSGARMANLTDKGIVQMSSSPLVELIESSREMTDLQIAELLKLSIVQETELMPTVEALSHAYLLTLDGVNAVGHSHVLSINSLLCSDAGWSAMKSGGRLFPDEIVVCGAYPCCVPYTDPGLPLARAIRLAVQKFIQHHSVVPQTIYLQNHGFIALGRSTDEVIAITAMAEKAAKIMLGAFACGVPRFLTPEDVSKIATRPDEKFRQRTLGLTTE